MAGYVRTLAHRAMQAALKKGRKNPKISVAMKKHKKTIVHRRNLSLVITKKKKGQTQAEIFAKQYARLLAKQVAQAGRSKPITCEICDRGGRICFDHDHQTGLFRGWICDRCNSALGMTNDSPAILEKMVLYLRNQ